MLKPGYTNVHLASLLCLYFAFNSVYKLHFIFSVHPSLAYKCLSLENRMLSFIVEMLRIEKLRLCICVCAEPHSKLRGMSNGW